MNDVTTQLEAFITEFPHAPEEVLRELLDVNEDATTDDIIFEGEADSYSDIAYEYVEATGDLGQVPEWLRGHIDYDSIGRDFRYSGMYEIRHNGTGYYWTML